MYKKSELQNFTSHENEILKHGKLTRRARSSVEDPTKLGYVLYNQKKI